MKKILLLLIFIFSFNIYSKTLEGTILKVYSSEQLLFLSNGKKYNVTLYGIKSFNKNLSLPAFSDFISKKMHGKKAWVHIKDIDKNNITARVQIKSYPNINKFFIEKGYAQWNKLEAQDNLYFKKLEQKARDFKKGFWSKIR